MIEPSMPRVDKLSRSWSPIKTMKVLFARMLVIRMSVRSRSLAPHRFAREMLLRLMAYAFTRSKDITRC